MGKTRGRFHLDCCCIPGRKDETDAIQAVVGGSVGLADGENGT